MQQLRAKNPTSTASMCEAVRLGSSQDISPFVHLTGALLTALWYAESQRAVDAGAPREIVIVDAAAVETEPVHTLTHARVGRGAAAAQRLRIGIQRTQRRAWRCSRRCRSAREAIIDRFKTTSGWPASCVASRRGARR